MGSTWKGEFKWRSLEDLYPDPVGQAPFLSINPTRTKTQDNGAELEGLGGQSSERNTSQQARASSSESMSISSIRLLAYVLKPSRNVEVSEGQDFKNPDTQALS